MNKDIPPQLVVLAIIAKNNNGLTMRELASYIDYLNKHGIDTGYYTRAGKSNNILRELMLDVNTLRVLGLIEEVNDKLIITEKGLDILKKLSKNNSIIKMILDQSTTRNQYQTLVH